MKQFKRFAALSLALCMLLSVLPAFSATAFASRETAWDVFNDKIRNTVFKREDGEVYLYYSAAEDGVDWNYYRTLRFSPVKNIMRYKSCAFDAGECWNSEAECRAY